jgi:ketosteroid isomerase-like protein
MKRSSGLTLAVTAVVLCSGLWIHSVSAELASSDPSGEIRALEFAQNAAILRGDVSLVDRMTSDDFTFITPRGFLVTKAEMLRGLANGAFRYEYREIYELKIRVYGDAAVVTGRSLHTGQENGKDSSDAYRFTRVYIRQRGNWLSVAWQTTREDQLRTYSSLLPQARSATY